MTSRYLFLTVTFFSAIIALQAQTGKVRGFVYEKATDAPIPYANVVVNGTQVGAVANDEGYFVLSNVPVGVVEVSASFLGYETVSKQIVVKKDQITAEKFYLAESSEMLGDVEVRADRQARDTKVLTGVVSINPKEIQQFSVGGDADIIKAVQVLPGVITTGDQGGQLYIRGGAPIQNLILLDGMIIYNPFHSIGFFSVFDADIIRSADVYTGGFNADYGSRNSAVMDVKTRDANRKRFAGKVQASTYSTKLLLETPLGAKDKNGRAATSFLVSAKTSYLDQSSAIFYPYIDTEYDGLPFTFTDVYAKLTSQSDNGSKINAFGFSFNDAVRFGGTNSIEWDALGAGVDFTVVPPTSSVLLSGDFSYSSYNIVSVTEGQRPSSSGINGFNGGVDFTYFLRENDELKYGLEAIGYQTTLEQFNELNLKNAQVQNTTEIGAYIKYKLAFNRLLLEPGFRIHYYGSQSEASPEPRLGLKYNINDFLRVKAAAGLYSQNLVASNSDRDVVNLFYGFLSGPEDRQFVQDKEATALQKAQHVVAGFEVEVTKNIVVNVEGYIKDFKQITNVNRNRLYTTNDPDVPDVFEAEFISERGIAKGVDILAKYQDRQLYLWLAYSLGQVTRNDGLQEYFPYFDRRHNLNFVGSYVFGKDRSWEVSTRYNFGTGFPFTPTRAFYSQKPFLGPDDKGQVSYDYTTANGELDVLYGDLNSKRLPNYHRVDFSIKKTIEFTDTQKLELSAGATNILNYQNIFYYDRNENKRVDQLPIMPTVSVSYSF